MRNRDQRVLRGRDVGVNVGVGRCRCCLMGHAMRPGIASSLVFLVMTSMVQRSSQGLVVPTPCPHQRVPDPHPTIVCLPHKQTVPESRSTCRCQAEIAALHGACGSLVAHRKHYCMPLNRCRRRWTVTTAHQRPGGLDQLRPVIWSRPCALRAVCGQRRKMFPMPAGHSLMIRRCHYLPERFARNLEWKLTKWWSASRCTCRCLP